MSSPLQRFCNVWMLVFVNLKLYLKRVFNFRKTSKSNNQQIRPGDVASTNSLLRPDEFVGRLKLSSFVFVPKCKIEVHCNKGSTMCISRLISVVFNPTCIRKQNKNNVHLLGTKSNKTRYSTQVMQRDFPLLCQREYMTERHSGNMTTEKSHVGASSFTRTLHGHTFRLQRQQFCPRSHRPVQSIPDEFFHGESSIFRTFQTDNNGQFHFNHDQIVDILKERRFEHPEMKYTYCRRNTFISCIAWYYLQFNTYWSVDAFIDAGFYLKDNYGNLECFSCGLQIRHEIDDDPYRFHQNYSPHCLALR
ncbi:uncharacterized protein LOC134687481 [Mytilus trossulus]|uniref:uncharacterized protein LOC134687481 n=1 Tax=Mytilus trossulus TaxID=6551 RepID=UPI00300778AC